MRRRTFKKRRQIRKKKSLFRKKIFWIFLFIFLILGIIFYFLFFSQIFQIKEIRVFGNKKVTEKALQDLVNSKVERRIFLPTKSIFLLNQKAIEKALLNEFPQVAKANLKRKLPNILILEIKERVGLAVFCQSDLSCFEIDKEGIAFEPSEKENGLVIFSGKDEKIFLGKKVIQKEDLKSILEIQRQLKELEIEIEKFFLEDKKLTAKTTANFEIYFDLGGNVRDQLFNLREVWKEKILPENRGELEYIDLRFGNRVFFK